MAHAVSLDRPESGLWWDLLRWLAEIVILAGVYYGAARLGLLLAFEQTNASPVWPPSGIAFAAVLLRGYSACFGILAGALLANVVVFLSNQSASAESILFVSLLIGVGNTCEAVAGTCLLQAWIGSRTPLNRAQHVFKFVLVALVMCLVSATIGPTGLCLSGIVPWSRYGTVWFTWWLGDVTGILVLTPLLLTWASPFPGRWGRGQVLEAGGFLALLVLTGQSIFGEWFGLGVVHYALAYALIPFLVWAAFRFGQRGVVVATCLVSGIAIWGTIHGLGPFVRDSLNDSILLVQAFVSIATVTGLVLAAVLTERQQAEAALQSANGELARHAAQLEAANKELEAFAYSVSHDLRAPLRGIDGFSQALAEDCGDRLDEEGRQMLHRIRSASQRMAQLIDDLLNLSRLTRAEMRSETVDLSALAHAITDDLRRRAPHRQADILIADGLVAQGDGRLLGVALENLLDNAWKFTSKTARARIEFGVLPRDGKRAYFVRDNGAGYDMAYAGKLFGAFQRLHTIHEFPGTGIGLATVQRVIHRHAGRVWAEGAVGNGATFYFTL